MFCYNVHFNKTLAFTCIFLQCLRSMWPVNNGDELLKHQVDVLFHVGTYNKIIRTKKVYTTSIVLLGNSP